jgi:hypothetical protein
MGHGYSAAKTWKRKLRPASSNEFAAIAPTPQKRAQNKEPLIYSRHTQMVHYETPQ